MQSPRLLRVYGQLEQSTDTERTGTAENAWDHPHPAATYPIPYPIHDIPMHTSYLQTQPARVSEHDRNITSIINTLQSAKDLIAGLEHG